MTVHSTPVGALEGDMQTCPSPETLPIEAGDVEWVADLFDTLRSTPIAPDSPSDRVLIPGEPEAAQEAYNARHGLPVRPAVIDDVRALCTEWKVDFLLG